MWEPQSWSEQMLDLEAVDRGIKPLSVSKRRAAERRKMREYEFARVGHGWWEVTVWREYPKTRTFTPTEATYNRFVRIANAIIARRFEGTFALGEQGNDSFVWSIDRKPQ